jgi:hypothetical protein
MFFYLTAQHTTRNLRTVMSSHSTQTANGHGDSAVQTKVIFRTFHGCGDIVAIFPEVPHDWSGHRCVCFQRIGEHGSFVLDNVSIYTRPSTADEIRPLREHLEKIGYKLNPVQRVTAKMHAKRRQVITETLKAA